MKVEKLSENKIKITLTMDELKARKIDIHDIENDVNIAKNLFLDLISESELNEDFAVDDSQLFIEASSDNSNIFVVTITKIEHIPELSKYATMDEYMIKDLTKDKISNSLNKSSRKIKSITSKGSSEKSKIDYRVNSTIYAFESLDDILYMCEIMSKDSMFLGKNSLYKYSDNYFIVFSKTSVKNKKFLKTFIMLSEYCRNYYSSDIFNISVKEKSQLIIENKALQTLINI